MGLKGTQGSAYPYIFNRAVAIGRRNIQRDFSTVYHETWGGASQQPDTTPVAAKDADGILTTTAPLDTTTLTVTPNGALASGGIATLIPLYGPWTGGRNVVVTVTHSSSIVAVSGIITGIDINGRQIAETWSVSATGTSKTSTGKKAFKYVTQITIVSVADATADSVTVGDGDVLGLDVRCSVKSGLKELVSGTIVTNGVLVAYDATNSGWASTFSADPRGTYAPNTIPDASAVYDLWFITDDPEFSDG